MAIGGGMSCVKYLLFCFNLLFAITGMIILVVGIRAYVNAHPYVDLTDQAFYTSAPVMLIAVGLIVFIVAFFGCCGAVKENHCMIITFSVFLLLIFVAELGVGIAGYAKRDDLQTSVWKQLNESFAEYNNNTDVKQTFDIIQTDFSCCGVNGPQDWPDHNMPYPASCCSAHPLDNTTVCDKKDPTFHNKPCLTELVEFFKAIAVWLGGVGIGIAVVQLLGVVFACCLARSIRSQYETV